MSGWIWPMDGSHAAAPSGASFHNRPMICRCTAVRAAGQGGRRSQHHERGFTLVEILLTVIVLSILLGIALPSYQQFIMKSRRSDAFTTLSSITQAQERWRANNASYAPTLETLFPGGVPTPKYYRLSLNGIGDPASFVAGYQIHATPISSGPQARDGDCADIFIEVSGGNLSYKDTNPASTRAAPVCWPQ